MGVLAAGIQLYLVFRTDTFSSDGSYFLLRQAEHISETGLPLRYDELSHSGRTIFGSPLYWYLLGFFGFVFGLVSLKVLPILFVFLIPLTTYLAAGLLVKDKKYACIAAISSVWLPIMWREILNKLESFALFIPLSIIFFYLFLKIDNKLYLAPFLVVSFFIGALNPLVFVIVITLIMWHILIYVEQIKLTAVKKEATLFLGLFVLLFQFFFYKEVFLNNGMGVVYQNIPTGVLQNYFSDLSFLELAGNIGVLSIIFGIYGLFRSITKKNEVVLLYAAFALSLLLLLIFKLIPLNIGIVLLGVSFIIVSSVGYERFFNYLSITKVARFSKTIFVIMLLLIILPMGLQSINVGAEAVDKAPTPIEIELLSFIRAETPVSSVILGGINEGHLINYYTQRKNVIDTNFIGSGDINDRYNAVEEVYTTESEVFALKNLEKYSVDYIYLSKDMQEDIGKETLSYSINEECFPLIFQQLDGGKLYEVAC